MATTKPDIGDVWANTPAPEDIEKPAPAKFGAGWLFGEKPPNSWMNWLQNLFSKAFVHLNERGVLEWDSTTTYLAGAMVWDGGKVFKARVQNTNQSTALTTQWQEQSLPDMPTSGDGYILYYSGSKLFWKSHYDLDYGGYEGRDATTKKPLILPWDNTIGNIPLASELNTNELAVNFAERTIYGKRPDGTIVPLSGQASIVDQEFPVTADTQTTFSPVGGYTVNQIEVFVNGRKIGRGEYTANNGVDVVFTGLTPKKDDLVVISVWASFGVADAYTQAQTDALLATLRADRAGVTFDFAGVLAPTGSLECNGQVVLKADYPELYSAIGDLWATTGGAGTPLATEFRLPPQQIGGLGLFTRGIGAVGIGVYQADVFKSHNHSGSTNSTGAHTHSYNFPYGGSGATTASTSASSTLAKTTSTAGNHSHTLTINNTGDATETRPRSITMMKCIWTGK